jgi:hypothetical protein
MHIPAPYVHPIYTDERIDTPVGINAPLPVQIMARNPDGSYSVPNATNAPVFNVGNLVRIRTADILLVTTTSVTTDANRDLLQSTSTELPTLDGCGQYRKLVWFYFRAGGEETRYRVLARATDHNGAPLGAGWQEIVPATTLPGGANSWGRIEIPSAGDGYYDQYRIEVQRTAGSSNYSLTSKIVGVR